MNPAALLRRMRAEALEWSGANRRARARLDGRRAAILMYHRVLPRADAAARSVEPGMVVTPESFDLHLRCLAECFEVLPLAEIAERLRAGRPLPRGAAAITFDDGWRDNLVHALPALERRALPATIFIVAGRVGTPGAFWPDEVCRRMAALDPAARRRIARALNAPDASDPVEGALEVLKRAPESGRDALLEPLRAASPAPAADEPELLDWDEIDRMARAGIDFESHGTSHAILTAIDPEEAARELREARERLRERGHGRHALLAYPSGAWNAETLALARDAGYAGAVTTQRGLADADTPALALPRLGLHEDVSGSRAEFLRMVPGSGIAR